MSDLAQMILARIGSTFDGECHLSEDEARNIADRIEALERENAELRERCDNDEIWHSMERARDEAWDQVDKLRAERDQARRLALEEAAKVADEEHARLDKLSTFPPNETDMRPLNATEQLRKVIVARSGTAVIIAAAIRALSSTERSEG